MFTLTCGSQTGTTAQRGFLENLLMSAVMLKVGTVDSVILMMILC